MPAIHEDTQRYLNLWELSASGILTRTVLGEREVCFPNVYAYLNATILLRDLIYMHLISRSQPHSPEWWNVLSARRVQNFCRKNDNKKKNMKR